ncbi:MAG TPA: glycosyltransferase family 39 protein [Solirubrobacteraceae bacterium]|jgi:4-amino-4-deoxy-L-arabinose transferase-like glycosyltransferase|nr:glycosyltransferase family 39 protein [Solirubrobacteraceae bacterium]
MSYSLQTGSAAAPSTPGASATPLSGGAARLRERLATLTERRPRPELALLLALAAVLYLWSLSKNGFANDYYSAAVRSMSSSWHNFLFASADPSGVMTVDKPPLSLWVQALSVRIFGYSSWSMLVPQALMGVASVGLTYDLVRRRFGRAGGFVAGLALALTPITVAISRYNNPDALLVLCCVAALWCAVRALEDGRTRWLVLAGVCVGLGFETKMLVALTVVPGIALAYLWLAPRGMLRALRQLFAGGAAMVVVGGAWPLLVALTPAADRPWISGTSDNSILSLIFEYNGVGRVDGQSGGPGGTAGNMFGGETGVLRLLNSALGGQDGWLLGFALVSGLGLLVATRLRRRDPRTGWLLAVGGAFLVTAVLFSAASGIFHPYYVSLLAPFAAALVGAGAAQLLLTGDRHARLLAPPVLAGGVASELLVLHDYPGQLSWLPPVLIAACVVAGLALLMLRSRQARVAAAVVAMAALLLAPSVWALDTLGHSTTGTFPEGGPANVQSIGSGGGFGGRVMPGGLGARAGGPPGAGGFGSAGAPSTAGGSSATGGPPSATSASRSGTAQPLFGSGTAAGAGAATGSAGTGSATGAPSGLGGGASAGAGLGRGGAGAGGFGGGAVGAPMGNDSQTQAALAYVKQHGGGTIAVSSQSSAASAIIAGGAKVAGIGGFSGRESDVTVAWLAQRVESGAIRWVLAEQTGSFGGGGMPGDTRAGSKAAMTAVTKACRKVTLTTSATAASGAAGETGSGATGTATAAASGGSSLYDCQGQAQALESAGG